MMSTQFIQVHVVQSTSLLVTKADPSLSIHKLNRLAKRPLHLKVSTAMDGYAVYTTNIHP